MEQRPYYKLDAWQQTMELTDIVYQLSRSFPKEELYCLTSQLRRAAVSMPSNLAEGAARTTMIEFAQCVSVAYSSLSKFETQLLIVRDLGYHHDDKVFGLIDRPASFLADFDLYKHLIK